MKKKYLAVHFTKRSFGQFVDGKVVGLMPQYYQLVGATSQVSILFLNKIKMSKQHKFILSTISYV